MHTILVLTLASSLAINLLLFLAAYRLQSDKLTDISYALSFLTIAIAGLVYAGKYDLFSWVIFALPAVWAVRIGGFLLLRVLRTGKDRRFDGIREHFVRFGKFWLGQAITAWVLMLPVSFALYKGGTLTPALAVGAGIWLLGLIVEAAADFQKMAFKSNRKNEGKWIQDGVWKYSRHPNYFGEILVWWGIYGACFASLSTPERLAGLASPVVITLVLRFVSGVPPLEKSADRRWGKQKDYQDYKRRTRLLIPIPK